MSCAADKHAKEAMEYKRQVDILKNVMREYLAADDHLAGDMMKNEGQIDPDLARKYRNARQEVENLILP